MAAHPGWVYSPEQLASAVDPEGEASPLAVNVHISRLRSKLKSAGASDLIVTVRGAGWRLRRTPGSAASPSHQAPIFVGRERELKVLRGVLDHSEGRLALIVGEAGAGKTSLVEQLLASVSPRFEVVRAVCDGNGSGDHWLWRQVLGEMERRTGQRIAEGANGHLATRLLGGATESRAETLRGVDRTLAHDAVHRYLMAVLPLHSRPVIVFVDDLQWADDASLTMLGYLLKRLPTLPFYLLAACRSSDADSRLALRPTVSFAAQRAAGTHVRLGGLSDAEVTAFAHAVLGERLSAEMPERLMNRTGGNPLFVRECLTALADSDDADPAQAITPSLSALVRSELSWLPEDTQRLLRYCAVASAQFRPELVAMAAGCSHNPSAFDAALDSGALVPADRGHLRFRHALVRDALLEDLGVTEAEQLHLAIATAVVHSRAWGDQTVFQLAHHFARADAASRPAAVGYLVAAARISSSRFAFEDAISRLSEAYALLEIAEMEPLRAARIGSAILERLGGARSALADIPRSAEAYESAIAARPRQDWLARARLFTKLGHARVYQRDRAGCAEAFSCALRTLADAEGQDDAAWWQSWIEVRLAQADAAYLAETPKPFGFITGELEEPILMHGTVAQRVKYFVQLASDLCEQARWIPPDAAIEAARRGVHESEASIDDHLKSYAAIMLGSALTMRRELGEAEQYLRLSLSLAQRCADSMEETASLFFLGMAARLAGDVHMTEVHATELERVARERVQMPEMISGAEASLGWVALRRGDYREAEARSRNALETWQREPACSQSVWMMAWPAVSCALHRGDHAAAIEFAALMTRPGQQALEGDQDTRLGEAVTLHRRGQRDAARRLLEALEYEAREFGYV